MVRFIGILFSNAAAIDMTTSSQTKVITDLAQLTHQDIEEGMNESLSAISRLDISTRMKLKEMIRVDMGRYDLSMPKEKKADKYGTSKQDETQLSYGEVRHLLESTFGAYAQKPAYEMKSPYEKGDVYLNRKKRQEPPF